MSTCYYKQPENTFDCDYVKIEISSNLITSIPDGKFTFRNFCDIYGWSWLGDDSRRACLNGFVMDKYLNDYNLLINLPGGYVLGKRSEWGVMADTVEPALDEYPAHPNGIEFADMDEEHFTEVYTKIDDEFSEKMETIRSLL